MVLTYNDEGYNPKRPQSRVLLNKRATKHAPFLLKNSGKGSSFRMSSAFVLYNFAAIMSVLRLSKVLEIFA